MSHSRSGLPKLDLEPFDATPLYAAARSLRQDGATPHHGSHHGRLVLGIVTALLLAVALGAVAVGVLD